MFKGLRQKRIITFSQHNPQNSAGLLTAGFTLIEVMVAMLLLLVGILAFMQLQASAIKINEANKRFLIAQDVASQELELVKTIDYFHIKDNSVLTNSSFGYVSALSSLSANYQLAGIDTNCYAPATFCVYKGLPISKNINGTNVMYYYTLKLSVNPNYLIYPSLAEVDAMIYWRTGGSLKSMDILGFVGI